MAAVGVGYDWRSDRLVALGLVCWKFGETAGRELRKDCPVKIPPF